MTDWNLSLAGVRHEGEPEGALWKYWFLLRCDADRLLHAGKWEKIGGVDCYVATPTVDYPKDKVLLYIPDLFGPQLNNAKVSADSLIWFILDDRV